MTSFLSIFSGLILSSSFAFGQTCHPTVANLQKKLLLEHVYKFPLTYGQDIVITRIDVIKCSNQGINEYVVHYEDVSCVDLMDPERNLFKCINISCQSPAQVNSRGSVDFELAPLKACKQI